MDNHLQVQLGGVQEWYIAVGWQGKDVRSQKPGSLADGCLVIGTLLLPVAMKFATTRFGQKPTVAFEAKLSVFFCFYIFLSICLF